MIAAPPFASLETPTLLLELARLEANAARMRARCATLGVALRPHLKTAKSIDVARIAGGGIIGPITVSTLAEAAHFAAAGWSDILYATAIVPAKVKRAAAIQRKTGSRLTLVLDDVACARDVSAAAQASGSSFDCLVEVDCGEHRSGVAPASEQLVAVAAAVAAGAPHLRLGGVMTHAGHSYGYRDPVEVRALAEFERSAAAGSADRLRSEGHAFPIVSVGSTPTVMFAEHLAGVSEVRAGIYLFCDLAQLSRRTCCEADLAVSVLATVIGHQHGEACLVIDAGALALSKDVSANRFLPDVHYGWVCDASTLERLADLSVAFVHQEHGSVPISDVSWFARLPIGSQVRILPNHACLTCAAYTAYDVVADGRVTACWDRVSGW